MLVSLSADEIEAAAIVAVKRVAYNVGMGRNIRYGERGWGWDRHIEGAIAEYVAAKVVDGVWTPSTTTLDYAGDVGDGRQVRSTSWRNGKLIVHEEDPDDHKFLLAIVQLPTVRLAGWLFGHEAKKPQFWDDPQHSNRPAYFVPQRCLRQLRVTEPV